MTPTTSIIRPPAKLLNLASPSKMTVSTSADNIRLYGAVGPKQARTLVRADMQAHAEEHIGGVIASAQVDNFECIVAVGQSRASRLPR
jgi:hypothetical protein